ncbi:A-kinase anchor protein 13-like, partial [Coregonus clupeaformis]|uniref:A-kinase anchor protein 13-like n=1 Tax=Coregonus clupeaformis TaxID=59861 RepID=UPI001E1C94FD
MTGDSTSEVSVSCSSRDDTASMSPASSSPESCVAGGPGARGIRDQGAHGSWSPVEDPTQGATAGEGEGGGETEEEVKDRLTEVPRRPAKHRPSIRSLSPFRRHSWGPGKNTAGKGDMNQRSCSLEGLSEVRHDGKGPSARGVFCHQGSKEERGVSLVSLTEESELGACSTEHGQKSRRYRPLRHSCPPMTLPLTKSVSMLNINQRDMD